MKSRDRWIAIGLALAGVSVCLIAVSAFVANIVNNNLVWSPEQTAREHYQAVGHSYSEGFAIGFFLCFFLALAAVGVNSWMVRPRPR